MKMLIKVALLTTALAAILVFSSRALSTTPPGIEVTDSDVTREVAFAPSAGLDTTFGAVTMRTVVEYVDTYVQHAMNGPGANFQARLQEVAVRPLIGAAQSSGLYVMAAPASGLAVAIANVAQRIELHLVERSRDHALAFPGALLQDKVPPAMGRPSTMGARVKWTTNEFTTSVIHYGSTAGDLSKTAVDNELRKEHIMALDGMGPGITVYCQITNTDQSGNATTSVIYQVSGTQYVFMPSLMR